MFFDHSDNKLEIKNNKRTRKPPQNLEIKQHTSI